MDERVVSFRVGVMVVATIILAALLVLLFGEMPSLFRQTYTVYVKFPQAPGVVQDTPVRKSGILVGKVSKVEFDDNDGQVLVTIELDPEIKVRRDEVFRITGSLLGDAELQVVPSGNPNLPRTQIQEGETLVGTVAGNPLQALSEIQPQLNQAIVSLTGAGQEVGRLARNLNDLLASNDEQLNRIVAKSESSLDSFQTAMENINGVFGDEQTRRNLRESMAGLPELLRDTQATINTIERTAARADRNLENLEGFTRPLGERGNSIITNIDSSVTRLDELLEQLATFSRQLNSREGSLGQLINNPDVYQQLNEAATNINELTLQLRPIVADARVFADKIARHPGVIVRDAVKPGPGIK